MSTPQWYRISPEKQRESVRITPQPDIKGSDILQQAEALTCNGKQIFISDTQGALHRLILNTDLMFLQMKVKTCVGRRYQQLSTFLLGNQPHLLAYSQSDGIFDFFRLTDTGFEHLYCYQRTYGDTTNGYTAVHAYHYRNQCLFMGYNATTGMSRIYTIQVPPQAALSITQLWQSQWSEGWKHFCFFSLGGENFFFKINPVRKKINIDHYADNPSLGAHPVGTHFPQMQKTSSTTKIELLEGPGFVAYQADDGLLSINRFASNCQRVSCQGETRASPGFQQLLAVDLGCGETLLALH